MSRHHTLSHALLVALPALFVSAFLPAFAAGIALLVRGTFSLMSFIPIVPAISAVIGAVVAGYALVDHLQIPRKYQEYAALAPRPLPAFVTPHIAAVVFFGAPSARFIRETGAPPITIGARFLPKKASFCAPGDTICDGAPIGQPSIQHGFYPFNGMTFAAADFVVPRL